MHRLTCLQVSKASAVAPPLARSAVRVSRPPESPGRSPANHLSRAGARIALRLRARVDPGTGNPASDVRAVTSVICARLKQRPLTQGQAALRHAHRREPLAVQRTPTLTARCNFYLTVTYLKTNEP
jgi:hypothetical protein